ncbi:hypothetical protein BDV19DRAFT_393569 [Aspergillus venezuelensis]
MEELNGRWSMDKSLTTGTDAILKMQRIGWTLRKAVSFTTIKLEITVIPSSQSQTSSSPTQPETPTTINISATLTGSLAGNKEIRILDWSRITSQHDYFLGSCEVRSELVTGIPDEQGDIYPDFEMVSVVPDERAKRYLRGEIHENGARAVWNLSGGCRGGKGVWVHTMMWNRDVGWTVEQIWAVEVIDGKKYHTRRIVVADKGQYVLGKTVFSYLGGFESAKE